jgi:hypothetical protein
MRSNNKKPLLLLVVIGLVTMLSSFAPRFGGEGYQIFVNSKLVLERFGKDMDVIQTLKLDQYAAGSQLTVRYYHCGKIGKGRTITLKDDNMHVLKQWKYNDVNEPVAGMHCNVKDIMSLETGARNLKLYYASSELPEGRLLASIQVNATAKARP